MIRYLLYFLIFLPFERIKFGSLGEYNFKAILLILIAVLLFKKALVSNTLNFKLFIYTVSVVVLGYFLSAIVMRGEDIDSTILQLFGYAPLMISALIIFGRLKCIELDDLIKVLPIMIGMSGFLAIMIFYIYPDFMPSIYKEDELSIEWGRLPWINASNTLVALMIIMIAIVKRKDTYIIYISTGFALLATMLTFSRSLILTCLLFFVASLIIARKLKVMKLIAILGLLLSATFNIISPNSVDSLENNINYRIFGAINSIDNLMPGVDDRLNLYEQYIQLFIDSPLFGIGLAKSFLLDGRYVPYADITLVSLILPFGIFGGIFGLIYFFKLLVIDNSVNLKYENKILRMNVIFGLFLSLNEDVWCHKEYSILIGLIYAALYFGGDNEKRN